jgi:hypothetical protein
MAISDWMKPKWKHSDPQVRRTAVERMGPDSEPLRTLALTDPDPEVRVTAVSRIDDEDFLREVAASKGDSPALVLARQRLNGIYRQRVLESQDAEKRRAALDRLADEDILFEIACTVTDPEIRLRAAERISDRDRLCELTRRHCGPRVGMAVVERLSSEDRLRQVAESATSKKVKRAAREKLEILTRPPETPDAAEVAEADRLCRRMEALADVGDLLRLRADIAEIEGAWDRLELAEDHPLRERLDAARSAARLREAALADQEAARETLVALCGAAEALADAELDPAMAELATLRERLKAAEAAAQSVLTESVRAHYRARFETATEVLTERRRRREAAAAARQSAAAALEALCREAERLATDSAASEEDWRALQDRWTAVGEAPAELAARMAAARRTWTERRASARAAREAERTEAADRLETLVETMEAAAAAADRSGLEAVVRKTREEWRSVPPDLLEAKAALAPRFDAAFEEFSRRQREFREHQEWEWWANLNRKEELCRVVEAMAEVNTLEGMAVAVREAHQQWKEIGPVSRDQVEAIWERFSGACNRAYQRCLARKQALLETVQKATAPALDSAEASEGDSDGDGASGHAPDIISPAALKAITETVKTAQTEWNAIGPLPAALVEDIRNEFRDRCDRYFAALRDFYDARDAERQDNLARKIQLCEAAEALADSEDWADTAGRIKALQRQWRDIGPVPREENQAVWERFRRACDAFFQRLKAREPEHIQRREDLIARAEAQAAAADAPDADMDAIAREIMALQKEWKAADPVPPEMVDALWERFHAPCNRFFQRYKGLLDDRKSAQADNEAAKAEMVAQAEALADSTDWRETGEALKALQRQWREVGPAPRRSEQALWNRFRAACDQFFQNRNAYFEERRQEREIHHHRREELCAAAEALVLLVAPEAAASAAAKAGDGEAAPAEGEGVDMAAEQLRAGLHFKDEVVVPGNPRATWSRAARKIREFQAEWRKTGGARGDEQESLWRRFRAACDRVYAARPEDRSDAKSRNKAHEEARA